MRCPACNHEMEKRIEKDVLIDFCPSCTAIWLDKPELSQLITENSCFSEAYARMKHEIDQEKKKNVVITGVCPTFFCDGLLKKIKCRNVFCLECASCGGHLFYSEKDLQKVVSKPKFLEKIKRFFISCK